MEQPNLTMKHSGWGYLNFWCFVMKSNLFCVILKLHFGATEVILMEFEIPPSTTATHQINYGQIDKVITLEAESTDYEKFFSNFLLKNIPCVIKGITNNWEAKKYWIKDNSIDLTYLKEKYGKCDVTIYNCEKRYFNSQNTRKAIFEEYMNYWKTDRTSGDNVEYLKDWHLKLTKPDDNFYDVPIYFASDWLNEYYVQYLDDDYRFVYIGVKDTWTPFHADVFTSYSWSANVFGKKKWILFPPGEEEYLKDNFGNLPYDVTETEHSRKYFEIIQSAGEAVFVPSGWHHQVWNLEDTISVNHNWVNGCNIDFMWEAMRDTFRKVVFEISDCRSMENFDEHCQVMLKVEFGMNFEGFYDFLKCIATNRLKMCEGGDCILFHGKRIGKNHIKFDLGCLKRILSKICMCTEINYEEFNEIKKKCSVLKDDIEMTCV